MFWRFLQQRYNTTLLGISCYSYSNFTIFQWTPSHHSQRQQLPQFLPPQSPSRDPLTLSCPNPRLPKVSPHSLSLSLFLSQGSKSKPTTQGERAAVGIVNHPKSNFQWVIILVKIRNNRAKGHRHHKQRIT